MFDFTESKLLRLGRAAKQLGCELFVLDDGWFGKRNSDTSSLGDYTVNEKKLPGGLRGLGEKLNAMGLQFGLWFEPESVSPDSELYRQHPDWALHDVLGREDLLGRHQLLLDLTKPEVRDYLVESVGGILDSAPICYVKWDMNRHSCALGAQQHAFVLGLYDVLRRIFLPRPQILLESCSSGGNRFDCGMLWFSPQIWCSDDTDPVERLRIQQSLSFLYPPSCFGTHVSASPHAQTLRHTPLSTRGNVSLFGCLGSPSRSSCRSSRRRSGRRRSSTAPTAARSSTAALQEAAPTAAGPSGRCRRSRRPSRPSSTACSPPLPATSTCA